MCIDGSTEDGCQAASMDETTINAMDTVSVGSYKGVEINTGPLSRGQWTSCWASRICFALTRLASKILKHSTSEFTWFSVNFSHRKNQYKYFN